MSIDLIGLVKEAITPEAINKLSSILGESTSATQKALEGGVPAILAGMASQTSSGEGLAGLLSLFKSGIVGSGLLANFSPILNGSGGVALMDFGHEVVESVLGDKAVAVADAISSQSGVRPSSALSLLGMAGPLAMGAIAKASGSPIVTVSSLINILASQRETIARFLPAGLGSVFGGATQTSAAAFAQAGVATGVSPQRQEKSPLQKFWPLLAVLSALVVGGLVWSITQESAPPAATDAVAPVAANVPANTGVAVKVAASPALAALGEFSKRKLPDGTELNIPQLGIENKLIDFITGPHAINKDTWFDFDRLLFDTGSATLQPSSQEQLDNIASILKAYPKVKVRIGGYTDNVGISSANLGLSTERAHNVMGSLVKAGVTASRMSAQGYGEIHPVADNATEEGRAKNRRISLRVTEK